MPDIVGARVPFLPRLENLVLFSGGLVNDWATKPGGGKLWTPGMGGGKTGITGGSGGSGASALGV